MLYFAYGSNLDPKQMAERCPGHHTVGMAVLHEHRLGFPRYSRSWDGGTASVVPAHGQDVWGMVYDVTDEHLRTLDGYEGYKAPRDQHNEYEREVFTVELVRPDDGSIPRRVRAAIYVAHPANASPPSRRYLDVILTGARHHRLPEEYVAAVSRQSTASEDEPARPEGGATA